MWKWHFAARWDNRKMPGFPTYRGDPHKPGESPALQKQSLPHRKAAATEATAGAFRLPRDKKVSRKGIRDVEVAFCRTAGQPQDAGLPHTPLGTPTNRGKARRYKGEEWARSTRLRR